MPSARSGRPSSRRVLNAISGATTPMVAMAATPPTRSPRGLTKSTIEALQPKPGVQYVEWDTDVRGFGVRVSPAGAKTFILKYRLTTGRVRWKTIGRVGALALDQARARARRDRGKVADGIDPLSLSDDAKAAITVAAAGARFLKEHAPRKKPGTQRMYRTAIDGHIRPVLGAIPIGELDSNDAGRLHHRLAATPYQANRVLSVLSKLLAWSMAVKLRPAGPNPCLGLEKYREHKRRRYLDVKEYGRVGAALRAAKRQTTIGPGPLTAIELLLLTGARPNEIATLQWAHVDLKAAALHLPDSKTGAKVIHLSAAALQILKRWPRFAGSPFVFPGNGRRVKGTHLHPTTLAHAWDTLRAAATLTDVRLYDACRHSYASVGLTTHNLSLAQVGEQLGHSQPSTTHRYAHLHDDVAKQNATAIGGSIAALLKRRAR